MSESLNMNDKAYISELDLLFLRLDKLLLRMMTKGVGLLELYTKLAKFLKSTEQYPPKVEDLCTSQLCAVPLFLTNELTHVEVCSSPVSGWTDLSCCCRTPCLRQVICSD